VRMVQIAQPCFRLRTDFCRSKTARMTYRLLTEILNRGCVAAPREPLLGR
jgi:hypothetical protein